MRNNEEKKTLIIVDVQNDFMPGGSLEVAEGDLIVPVINRLVREFDLIVATQDWHPQNHSSFASNHEEGKPFDTVELHGQKQVLWPDHCVQGSEGADLFPGLDIRQIEAIFRKGADPEIDSYSAFYDNGHRKRTGLAGYLKEKEVSELYFCGLAADICVYFSVLDALKEGFSVTVIDDGVRPLNPEEYERLRHELVKDGVRVVQSDAILA